MKTMLLLSLSVISCSVQAAGDAEAGKSKTATCVACHGPVGVSNNPLWPSLAGQKDQYLIKQMQAFREGVRQDPMMAPMAKALTDQDIEDLAAFYSQLSCSGE